MQDWLFPLICGAAIGAIAMGIRNQLRLRAAGTLRDMAGRVDGDKAHAPVDKPQHAAEPSQARERVASVLDSIAKDLRFEGPLPEDPLDVGELGRYLTTLLRVEQSRTRGSIRDVVKDRLEDLGKAVSAGDIELATQQFEKLEKLLHEQFEQ